MNLGEPCGGLFHLAQGWLMFTRFVAAGRPQILQFGLPGTVTGCLRGVAAHGVQALTEVVVSEFAPDRIDTLGDAQPDTHARLTALAARSPRFAIDWLPSKAPRPARERVAVLLLELFIRSRAQWPNHTAEHMLLPLSDDHVADATALVGVPSVLRDLEQKGIIRLYHPGIAILDPDKLVDAAGVELALMRSFLRI